MQCIESTTIRANLGRRRPAKPLWDEGQGYKRLEGCATDSALMPAEGCATGKAKSTRGEMKRGPNNESGDRASSQHVKRRGHGIIKTQDLLSYPQGQNVRRGRHRSQGLCHTIISSSHQEGRESPYIFLISGSPAGRKTGCFNDFTRRSAKGARYRVISRSVNLRMQCRTTRQVREKRHRQQYPIKAKTQKSSQ